MSVQTALTNGAYITANGLFKNALLIMQIGGWFGNRHANKPFLIHNGGETLMKSEFTLTHGDMVHVTTLMFQKLFPNASWKRTWKRKTGHEQWITTEQVVKLVVFDPRYNRLCSELLVGDVQLSTLMQFEYFRRCAGNGVGLENSRIRAWQHETFITSELMRELDCKNDHPKLVRVYHFA